MITRRGLLTGTIAGVVATACGRNTGPTDPDLRAATAAAGVERVAIDSYEMIRDLLTKGALGAKETDAVATFVVTAADQHHKAMEQWTSVLAAGGRGPVDAPDRRLKPVADTALNDLRDVVGVARLALQLEDYASQTYLQLIPTLQKPSTAMLAGQLLVVDQQHQAVLRYLIGLYPVGSGMDNPLPTTFAFAPAEPRASLVTG